ncbi:MAG: hypothetical protein AAGG01_12120, partial [Planctomycetota bacterium]
MFPLNLVWAPIAPTLVMVLLAAQNGAQQPDIDDGSPPTASVIEVIVRCSETGKAIEGARVLAGYERLHPTWGETWWRAERVTGPDGTARMPAPSAEAPYERMFAVAPGFGTRMVDRRWSPGESLEMPLPPEVPLELELVFEDGQPACLVHVGAAFGCGHMPDVLSAVSDHRGHVTLHGLSPREGHSNFELYPVGPGVYFDSLWLDEPWQEGVRQRVVVRPGRRVAGQILGYDGTPAKGVYVGQPRRHRGPWARTDEQGRFVLWGTDPDQDFIEIRDANDGWMGGRRIAGRCLDVLIRTWDEVGGAAPPKTYPAVVDLSGSPNLEGISDVEIEFWSPYTGLAKVARPDREGVCSVELEAGSYLVEVGERGGAVELVHAGALRIGPASANSVPTPRLDLAVPPIQMRKLEIQGHQSLASWRLDNPHGKGDPTPFTQRELDPEPADEHGGHWATIKTRWLPACGWTLAVLPAGE